MAVPAGPEQQAVAVFVALADPTRRAILNELARHTPIARQAVGRRHPYRLDPAPIRLALVPPSPRSSVMG